MSINFLVEHVMLECAFSMEYIMCKTLILNLDIYFRRQKEVENKRRISRQITEFLVENEVLDVGFDFFDADSGNYSATKCDRIPVD